MGASRSGTSLTAGVFASHGVWTGDCLKADRRNPKGFYGNISMKKFFKSGMLTPEHWRLEVFNILSEQKYNGGHYLFKHGGERWKLWKKFQAPYIICCRRDYESVSNSRIKAGFTPLNKSGWQKIQNDMDDAIEHFGGVNIYPDQFRESFSPMVEALEYCGIEPDMEIIEEFYDPELWHHSS